ncbi:MAG: hypothetical protein FWF68_06245 [Spirochaetes bacterium]|nr:hypothetical protein [Spirochaetota bacterium]
MKKLIYAVFAALLALSFTACGNLGQPSEDNTQVVKFTTDKNGNVSVTIPLDGEGVPSQSAARALTQPRAQSSYDLLEVVFTNGTSTARASWSIGNAMTISGVPRGVSPTLGIAYGSNAPTGLSVGDGTSAGVGAATLFVGKKTSEGNVLLAVGKVMEVDGVTSTTVTTASKSVTFGLAALTGNTVVNPSPTDTSSFAFTTGANSVPTTYTTAIGIPVRSYNMNGTAGAKVAAYTLGSSSTQTGYTIAGLLPGIRTVSTTGSIIFRDPSLNTTSGAVSITVPEVDIIDHTVTPTITTLTTNGALPNPININFTTTATTGAISFYFTIPVFAVTTDTTNGAGITVPAATTWVIMPGTLAHSLDGGVGASILISNGVPTFTVNDQTMTIIVKYNN